MDSSQQRAWEDQYANPGFLSLDPEPQAEVRRFIKWLKREGTIHLGKNILQDPDTPPQRVLDLGCGNGRNLNYFAFQYGASGVGYDFAPTAIAVARDHARMLDLSARVSYETRSIGDEFPLNDASFDLILDITASNALYEGERDIYLAEMKRVLAPNGIIIVRILTSDGDKNAKNLLKMYPGPEPDTYILPDLGIMEHTFTEQSFRERYGEHFEIINLDKATGYQRWGTQSIKRRYIVAYLMHKK